MLQKHWNRNILNFIATTNGNSMLVPKYFVFYDYWWPLEFIDNFFFMHNL